MSGRMIAIVRTIKKRLKGLEKHEGVKQGYRWQSVALREISVFPLTKLIMDVPLRSCPMEK